VASFDKFRFMEQLRGVTMRPHDFRVLITLLTYADRYGSNAYPSISTLTADCQMNEKTVAGALQRLESMGLIVCRLRGGGRGRTTVWQIVDVPAELQPNSKTPRSAGGLTGPESPRPAGGIHPTADQVATPSATSRKPPTQRTENPPPQFGKPPTQRPENPPPDGGQPRYVTNVSTKAARRGVRTREQIPPQSTPQTFDPENPHDFNPDEPRPSDTCEEHPVPTKDVCIGCKVARRRAEYHDKQMQAWANWYFSQDEVS